MWLRGGSEGMEGDGWREGTGGDGGRGFAGIVSIRWLLFLLVWILAPRRQGFRLMARPMRCWNDGTEEDHSLLEVFLLRPENLYD